MAKQQQKPVQKAKIPQKTLLQKPVTATSDPKKKSFGIKLTLVQTLSIVLVIASFLIYANTLQNGYVMDDVMVVKDNSIVTKGISSVPELFSIPHMRGYLNLSNDTYRPLSLVMFAIEYQFFGANPSSGHFFNVIFYMGCVVLLFLFLDKLFEGKKTAVAFFAALLFAAHPIHTEVVANIKSRDEILCFFFAFLSLNLFVSYMKRGKVIWLITGALSLYLAFISKETVITFPAVIALTFFFYLNENKQRAVVITAASIAAAAAFLIVRNIVLTAYHANVSSTINFVDNCLTRAPTYMSRLATAIMILGGYLKLLFIPYPLICDHSFNSIPFTDFTDIKTLASLVTYLAMIVMSVWGLIKYKKNLWSFAILFYLITLSLFSNIFILIGSTMADRFMFFPSAGICLLMALGVEKWLIRQNEAPAITVLKDIKGWLFIAPVFLIFSFITYSRNDDWKSNISLYKADINKAPENTRLNYYYGCELQKTYPDETDPATKKQIMDESIMHLKKSLSIYPNNTDSHAELGVAYFRINEYDSAIPELYRTLQINPRQSNAAANLGTIFMNRKQYDSSLKYYHKTIANNPGNGLAYFNMAVCYSQIQKYDSAIYGFKKTIEIAPDFNGYKAYEYTAILYKTTGNTDSALKYEQLARVHNPKFKL